MLYSIHFAWPWGQRCATVGSVCLGGNAFIGPPYLAPPPNLICCEMLRTCEVSHLRFVWDMVRRRGDSIRPLPCTDDVFQHSIEVCGPYVDTKITRVNKRLDYVFKMYESICQHSWEALCDRLIRKMISF